MITDTVKRLILHFFKNDTLEQQSPLYLKLHDGIEDVTANLFGLSSFTLPNSLWGSAVDGTISNADVLILGTALEDYSGTLYFQLYNANDELLFELPVTVNWLTNATITYPSGTFYFGLSNCSTYVANWLLNYIFNNQTITTPTWYMQIYDKNDNPLLDTREQISYTHLSEIYTDNLNNLNVSYGDSFYVVTNKTSYLNKFVIYDQPTDGNSWYSSTVSIPTQVYKDYFVNFERDTFRISFTSNTQSFTKPIDTNQTLSADFDGTVIDYSNNSLATTEIKPTYNSEIKIQKVQSTLMSMFYSVNYDNVEISNNFNYQTFIYLSEPAIDRTIIFSNKQDVLKIYYENNQLKIDLNGLLVYQHTLVLLSGVWYHIFVQKTPANTLEIKVNNILNTTVSLPVGHTIVDNSNSFQVNSINDPIKGFCNGVYVSTVNQTYQMHVPPQIANPYRWRYMTIEEYLKLTPVALNNYV